MGPTIKIDKPQADRIRECTTLLKRLTDDIGVPATNPSIRVLRKRMAEYWRDGKVREDSLPLYGYDRVIVYKLPRWSHQFVEMTLKQVSRDTQHVLPLDLLAELEGDAAKVDMSGTPV